MADVRLSRHAEVRMQQRGIPAEVVDCLLDNGRRQHDKHGGQIVYFDRRRWNRLQRDGFRERIENFDRYRRAYAIICDNHTIATVGHRYKHLRRH